MNSKSEQIKQTLKQTKLRRQNQVCKVYKCSCGLIEDRDVKSAKTILQLAMEHSDFKPVEKETSADMMNYFIKSVSYISTKQEAQSFRFG